MSNQSTPFFSIIVPVYNRERFIGTLIRSLQGQQYTDFEMVLVNDGSTDKTEQVIRQFEDPRIKLITTPNRERGAARNAGAAVACGKYYNFFDSDDVMYAHHLQCAIDFIVEKQSPPWFHTCYEVRDEENNLMSTENGTPIRPEKRLIFTNYLGCDSVFVQRDFFLQNRFNEDRTIASSEDWELWLRMISRKPLMVCPVVTFKMIHHTNRSLLTISADRIIRRDTAMVNALTKDPQFVKKFRSNLALFHADRYTFFALSLIIEKRRREAWLWLVKSLLASPLTMTRRRFWACGKLIVQKWFR
jgi:glycosyltransferase involved in cell wall biosynthesis